MFDDLKGKNVIVHFGVISGITDTVKGSVIQVENLWLKIQTKKKIEIINLGKVSRITIIE
ncbi:hypothetical protein EXM22_04235 [Oceanispirochaeta crateris]|uniref:DUF2642 domain-containing protein n=1 Tax=Oceanispirochaeta crateris TaxID=2518645 RepID=A0A5C1QM53_9SPIO|nr:hypothetical protein [Oceanispirochaeta crateris]QEN07232.1 hypothetical protein EXM22_04235 [Oceanispirochaeta crateris]